MTHMRQKIWALVAILGILLAQGAVAAYSCPLMLSPPMLDIPCEQMDMDSGPLCEKHCAEEKQKPHDSGDRGVAPGFVTAYFTRIADVADDAGKSRRLQPVQEAIQPPLIIRNCTLRI